MEQVNPVTWSSAEEICCAEALPANNMIQSMIRLLIVFMGYINFIIKDCPILMKGHK
ncbi:hypothetical protein D3C87_1909600 [compost metagenome]